MTEPPHVTCPACGATSRHPDDVAQGYCGQCHWWTRDYARTVTDVTVEPIDGGYRVKRSDDGRFWLDILAMGYNFRLVTTYVDVPLMCDRFWCYAGKGPASLLRTIVAALAWSGADDTEPVGWNKNGQTGEWRSPEGAGPW